tara:strand:+ start:555 stop:1064 length:510 start_codon:yes stop_codon:yes gene_type:complete
MASELHVDTIKHSGGTSAMTIDSTGRILTPARPSFYATKTDAQTISGNTMTDVIMNSAITNVGSCYDTSNGLFTAPITGIYYIHAQWNGVVANDNRYFNCYVQDQGGTNVLVGRHHTNTTSGTTYGTSHTSGVVSLSSGNTLKVIAEVENSMALYVGDRGNSFTGYLIG